MGHVLSGQAAQAPFGGVLRPHMVTYNLLSATGESADPPWHCYICVQNARTQVRILLNRNIVWVDAEPASTARGVRRKNNMTLIQLAGTTGASEGVEEAQPPVTRHAEQYQKPL